MASGHNHATASIAVSIPVGLISFLLVGPAGLVIAIGTLSGVIITPDLDISNPIHADNVVEHLGRKAGCCFGQLFRGIWRIFWMPYSYIIPRHRHWSSHAPVIGTLGRVAYIGILTIGFCTTIPYVVRSPIFYLWIIGLMLSDILHWIMDR